MFRRAVLLTTLTAIAGASSAFAVDVQQLYDQKCKLCHSIKGEGGKKMDVGGPLDKAGERGEEWLRAYMADPKSKMPEAKMPKIKLSPDEMNAIVQYMLTLK